MRSFLELLKFKSWPGWLGPTFATIGVGGIIINQGIFTRVSGKMIR